MPPFPLPRRILAGLTLVGIVAPLFGADSVLPRQPATLIHEYAGSHQTEFTLQFDRVRLLVRQAQLEVSARLGLLLYQEGFQYPIAIRFDDGAPAGLESSLAYVQLAQSWQGFKQELVINLDGLTQNPADFDQVFTHEMTHAVLNDAVGGEASLKIPHWVQEGLAQYVSGEGDARVKRAARQVHKSQAGHLLWELDGPYSGYAYPQYYLAIKYIDDKFNSSTVQTFVRDLIAGKSVQDSIEDSLGFPWERFKKNVHDYSLTVFTDRAIPDFEPIPQ